MNIRYQNGQLVVIRDDNIAVHNYIVLDLSKEEPGSEYGYVQLDSFSQLGSAKNYVDSAVQ